MSYSTPYGMPPTMAERAEIFRRENRQSRTISGVQVLGRDGKDDSARVIFDPSPVDPFKRLPFYLTIAWTGAGMVVFGLLLSQLFMRVRRWHPHYRGLISLGAAVFAVIWLAYYGRVSPGSSIALRVAIATGLIVGFVDCVGAYRKRSWTSATILSVLFAGIALFVSPALLRF